MKKLENFSNCLNVLKNADFDLADNNDIYRTGVIGQFNLTIELAWKALQERSGLFHYQKQSYMIFSKSGFTEKLKLREQEEENVRLISFEDMNQL